MYFPSLALTNLGSTLLAKVMTGAYQLVFTGFKLGNAATAPASVAELTDLVSPVISFGVSRYETEPQLYHKQISISGVFDNADIAADFNATELGVFAYDSDLDTDILFGYAYSESPALIAANDAANIYRTAFTINLTFDTAINVVAQITGSDIYALQDDLAEHIDDSSNPHGVTFSQTGATAIVYGTYAGDGSSLREISLGFQPKAIFVCAGNGLMSEADGYYGGFAIIDRPIYHGGTPPSYNDRNKYLVLSVANPGSGFIVNNYPTNKIHTNDQGTTYLYVAFK